MSEFLERNRRKKKNRGINKVNTRYFKYTIISENIMFTNFP